MDFMSVSLAKYRDAIELQINGNYNKQSWITFYVMGYLFLANDGKNGIGA